MGLEKLIGEILEEITPTNDERIRLQRLADSYLQRTEKKSKEMVNDAVVFLGGSIEKDTMLRGDADIDVFVLLPTTLSKREFREMGLDIGRRVFLGHTPIERFADHPYLEVEDGGTTISIVPAYKTEAMRWKSAVDRTYYHVKYVKENLGEDQKGEVRLLKRFMKGVRVYGAESTVKGFSGYLCELLIIHYKTFKNWLIAAGKWNPQVIIDPANLYGGDLEIPKIIFEGQPLVVVDPVDKGRNVSAATSKGSLSRLISAVHAFLLKPSRKFFFPPIPMFDVKERLSKRMGILSLAFQHHEIVEDTLFPQLERLARKLVTKLKEEGFNTLRWEAYSNYRDSSYVLLELQSTTVPRQYLKVGPHTFDAGHEEAFLEKNMRDSVALWISEEGRWKAIKFRDAVDAKVLLRKIASEGKVVPRGIRAQIQKTSRIMGTHEIILEAERNPLFREFLTRFLENTEFWICDP